MSINIEKEFYIPETFDVQRRWKREYNYEKHDYDVHNEYDNEFFYSTLTKKVLLFTTYLRIVLLKVILIRMFQLLVSQLIVIHIHMRIIVVLSMALSLKIHVDLNSKSVFVISYT